VKAANWIAGDLSSLPAEFAANGRFGTMAGRAHEERIIFMRHRFCNHSGNELGR